MLKVLKTFFPSSVSFGDLMIFLMSCFWFFPLELVVIFLFVLISCSVFSLYSWVVFLGVLNVVALSGWSFSLFGQTLLAELFGVVVWMVCFFLWFIYLMDYFFLHLVGGLSFPWGLFYFLLELVTLFSRSLSLGFRLFLNLLSGKVLGFVFFSLGIKMSVVVGFFFFHIEMIVALVQALVFFMLTLSYLSELEN